MTDYWQRNVRMSGGFFNVSMFLHSKTGFWMAPDTIVFGVDTCTCIL